MWDWYLFVCAFECATRTRAALPREWDDTEVIPPVVGWALLRLFVRWATLIPNGGTGSVPSQASGADAPSARSL